MKIPVQVINPQELVTLLHSMSHKAVNRLARYNDIVRLSSKNATICNIVNNRQQLAKNGVAFIFSS